MEKFAVLAITAGLIGLGLILIALAMSKISIPEWFFRTQDGVRIGVRTDVLGNTKVRVDFADKTTRALIYKRAKAVNDRVTMSALR